MSLNKKSYFQGGGGVNQPTPGQKKYKVDKAIVVQPRFEEPFYRNYDLYNAPGVAGGEPKHGPGAGWHSMQKYKSVKEFLDARREKMKDKYKADDSWIEDTLSNYRERVDKMKIRTSLLSDIIKTAGPNYDLGQGLYSNLDKYDSVADYREDSPHGPGALMTGKKKDINHIDFPVDDEVNHYDQMVYPEEGSYHVPTLVGPEGGEGDLSTFPSSSGPTDFSSYINSTDIAGEHSYLPLADQEDRSGDALDFGRDYTEETEFPGGLNEEDLQKLMEKYLSPAETDLFGLPDGIDPISDLDPEQTMDNEEPYDTVSDIGQQIYEDKWNI